MAAEKLLELNAKLLHCTFIGGPSPSNSDFETFAAAEQQLVRDLSFVSVTTLLLFLVFPCCHVDR